MKIPIDEKLMTDEVRAWYRALGQAKSKGDGYKRQAWGMYRARQRVYKNAGALMQTKVRSLYSAYRLINYWWDVLLPPDDPPGGDATAPSRNGHM